jgi:hypothetical protein
MKEKEEKAFYNLNSRTDSRSGQNRGREGRDGRDRRPPVEDLRGRIGQAKGSGSDYKHGSLSREKERQKSRSHQVKPNACRKIGWLFDPDVKKDVIQGVASWAKMTSTEANNRTGVPPDQKTVNKAE